VGIREVFIVLRTALGMELIVNLIGYAAAVMGTLIMILQLVKTIRTKSVKDVSMGMLIIFLINCFLWVIYGFLITSWPIVISNALVFTIVLIEIVLKLKYN